MAPFPLLNKTENLVGGCTAGLALAERLAENGTISVAVIEAGSFYELDNSNRTSIPAFGLSGIGNDPVPATINSKIDWEQCTTPQSVSKSEEFLTLTRIYS